MQFKFFKKKTIRKARGVKGREDHCQFKFTTRLNDKNRKLMYNPRS